MKYNTHPQNIAKELNLGGIYSVPARCVFDGGKTVVLTALAAAIETTEIDKKWKPRIIRESP